VNKGFDFKTADAAMLAKIKDAKAATYKQSERVKKVKTRILHTNGGRRFVLNKMIKKMKIFTDKKKNKQWLRYEKKMYRCEILQKTITGDTETQHREFIPTQVPSLLKQYEGLCIFGTPQNLPEKEEPLGPYICNTDIKLSLNEKKILSKTPKFSTITDIEDICFMTETERMLSKQRYNENNKGLSEKHSDGMCVEHNNTKSEKKDKHITEKELWESERHRYIYDPFSKEINFTERRATDYPLNKRIMLPRPMDANKEFECEVRRRKFLATYEEYKHIKNSEITGLDKGDTTGSIGIRRNKKDGSIIKQDKKKKTTCSMHKRIGRLKT